MKKILLLAFPVILYSCGGNDNSKKESGSTTTTSETSKEDPKIQQGLDLIAKNDCFGCHKVAEPLVGPPYEQVSEKYKDGSTPIDTLVNRVIHGSTGHWGTAQMTPHPNLAPDSARLMVEYILSLKK